VNQIIDLYAFQIKEFKEIVGKTQSEFEQIIKAHQYKTLWTYLVNCILGLWLITSPHLYDYKSSALATSDTVSGASIILFECLAFSPHRTLVRWCTPAVALWLFFAPLVFWSPTPAAYLIDTLIACLVIALSILLPGMAGKGGIDLPGPDQPPGWTYNPSSWIRRWLGIALALVGFFISRYLAAHQLGYIPHAFDPFFGSGTDKVTGSALSRSFPISDAGFGSVAYIMETLTGFMGDRARWRTAPWIAVMFAVLVLPLGATSVVLVIMQPVVVGAWCGLCLISAAALLSSVPLAVHEAIAVGQFLLEAKAQKKNLWQVFWMGGSIAGAGAEDPDRTNFSLSQRWIASIRGVTVPWTILAQLAIGIWLMARPDILPSSGRTADCDHLLGAIIVTVAAVATAEVTRIARLINILPGTLLIAAALLLARDLPMVFASEVISGLVLICVSIPKGRIVERYAGWDKYVK
jgi:uncharacterized membrane protein